MRELSIAVSLISLMACSNGHTRQVTIAAAAVPYVLRFERDANLQGRPVLIDDLIVRFEDLGSGKAGACAKGDDVTPTITLSSYYWPMFDEGMREELVYHELGHCILNRPHLTATTIDNGEVIYKSIMNNNLFAGITYEIHRSYYVHELFHAGY